MIWKIRCKLIYWLSIGILACGAYLSGLISVMLYYPYKVIDIQQPIEIISSGNIVISGEDILLHVKYHKYKDVSAEVYYQLYNHDTKIYYSLKTESSNLPMEQCGIIKGINIPKYVRAGTYSMVITIVYRINAIRVITYKAKSEKFMLVDSL